MRYIILVLLMLIAGPAYAEEDFEKPKDCKENDVRPRCLFDIDPDGEAHSEDGEAETTFGFPPIKKGFLIDFKHPSLLPFVSIEAVAFKVAEEHFAVDIGGTLNRAFVSFGWELIPIMKLGPTIWLGWHVPDKQYTFGVGFQLIEF